MDYNNEYYNGLNENWSKSSFPIISNILLKYMPTLNAGQILDLGCGTGAYYEKLKQTNNNVYGIDISKDSIEICSAKKYHSLIQSDASILPYNNCHFDFVFCTEVIEHVEPYDLLIREIHRVLKPKGKALITTTNYSTSIFVFIANYSGTIKHFFGELIVYLHGYVSHKKRSQFIRKWCFEPLGGHYHGFGKNQLTKAAKISGFKVCTIKNFYAIQPIPFSIKNYFPKIFSRRNHWSIHKRILIFILSFIVIILNPVFRLTRVFANNLFLVVEKK